MEQQATGSHFSEVEDWEETHVNNGNQITDNTFNFMMQKKDKYLASLSQQELDMPIEELTPDPEVSLQLLMDTVGRPKGKELCSLGVG